MLLFDWSNDGANVLQAVHDFGGFLEVERTSPRGNVQVLVQEREGHWKGVDGNLLQACGFVFGCVCHGWDFWCAVKKIAGAAERGLQIKCRSLFHFDKKNFFSWAKTKRPNRNDHDQHHRRNHRSQATLDRNRCTVVRLITEAIYRTRLF